MNISAWQPQGLDIVCTDAISSVFGLLDPSIAPSLLYYSYIPIIFVVLLFGIAVFLASHATPVSRLFFWIAVVFSLLIGGEILLWIAVPVYLIHFIWQIIAIWHALLIFLLANFVYLFVREKLLPNAWQWALVAFLAPILILTPTIYNLVGFNFQTCEGISGPLWSYIYILEAAIAVILFDFCFRAFKERVGRSDRSGVLVLGSGILIFWIIFIASNFIGDATLTYNINLIGPVGMIALIATLSYLIVRYHAFNLRVFAAQALVAAVLALLFAALFVRTIEHARYVLIGTFALVVVLGTLLIRGVRQEIRQRELIQKQEEELEVVNKQQENLLHFISHEIKGYLTKSEGGFAGIVEGDYGTITTQLKEMATTALEDVRKGVATVMQILNASNLKKGTVNYAKKPFDLKSAVLDVVNALKPTAQEKHLTIETSIADGKYIISGDEERIREDVIRNLIDNAIKYAQSGIVRVQLNDGDKMHFSVKDNGIGITPEDMRNLFTEGGHGKDSIKMNVHSTGYGLFIAKSVVEAHGGKIWAESEGVGKGSLFTVELPAA
ncbi:hypothetical protein A3F27_00435 [Candidatus Kaiserbacteria bacterium RIFCSPHIGHO2_12_FULL_53_13]|uniref:histidine kinase n=1 Tax=Candidatus Kaiserbacteria bacterium RIFCSPHIGHO2_12_FULL_53_13 TaxID=1798502 RepID=A0A1F6E792_9BACT|nr:MAG: hypothetical protein A3F27_00435 [Candidatus Kaiserbacteria bacterium RIFCSPHIGHO2_12_FULL_53_13]OGG74428.1 MAG: hypothetical protein A3A37_02140 [Candidatus Kaiserbacteria bacterium RIFCSPLOWO2_01_FULL_52_36]